MDGGSPVARTVEKLAVGEVGRGALEAEPEGSAPRKLRHVPLLLILVRIVAEVVGRALKALALDGVEALGQDQALSSSSRRRGVGGGATGSLGGDRSERRSGVNGRRGGLSIVGAEIGSSKDARGAVPLAS